MTTFTTEDRILAEKDGSLTINVNGGSVTSSPPHIVDSGASVMNNEPVAWMSVDLDGRTVLATYEFETAIPLYTHPAKNNGGNPEELNTRQIQDALTSLESTPPFAYAIVSKQCPDDMENMSLQFNEPVDAKKVIPLYTHPAELTDEEIDEVVRRWFGNSRYDFSANTWRQFSRAIIRKAQEK